MGILNKILQASKNANIIPIIDASNDMNDITKDLIKNYKSYCNYDEILRINEKDRLPILQFIWSKWMVHGSSIEKDLQIQYEQYDLKDIRLIVQKEHKRVINLRKQKQAIIDFEKSDKEMFLLQPFMDFSSSAERNRGDDKKLCLVYDIHKISDAWYTSEGYIDSFFFGVFTSRIKPRDLRYYKFWVNGEIKHLSEPEFLEWCKSYNIDYPLY